MRRGDKTPSDLDRPEGNDLQTNYEKHDVGHRELVERLHKLDCEVVEWGIDRRDDDGDDGIIYDDKMDFKVFHNGELVALIDVKTKGSPKYMGRFNERHYAHYFGHAKDFEAGCSCEQPVCDGRGKCSDRAVPVFVAMFQVHYKKDRIDDEFVFEVGRDALGERVISSDESDAVPRFPDGNAAVMVPHEHRKPWSHLEMRIEEQKMKITYDT